VVEQLVSASAQGVLPGRAAVDIPPEPFRQLWFAAAEKALAALPKDAEAAKKAWTAAKAAADARARPLGGMPRHAQQFAGDPDGDAKAKETYDTSRRNFLALVFCLMLGTAALPHILVRSYTTRSVPQARMSVFWALFFIMLLYTALPALAVMVKYEIYTTLVGADFGHLPSWVNYWANIDRAKPMISITDINADGLVQLAEIAIDGDMIVLATPEIAGLPYVISALIAAGALAAALSTADGLLLTISSALSHDTYFKMMNYVASSQRQVTVSKLLLLVVALLAAYTASFRSGDILSMVSGAFSLAASTLFPALVLGVFWKRANQQGAIAGMLTGFLVCLIYLVQTSPALGGSATNQWFHIAPVSAGVFGVPAGLFMMIVVTLVTPAPGRDIDALVDKLRQP